MLLAKKRFIKPFLIFFILNLFLSLSFLDASAAYPKDIRIKDMSLSLWPEYDDPRVLVMYQGEFYDDVAKPAKLKFLIPKGFELVMAGAITKEGRHIHTAHQIADKGERVEISFEVNESTFYLEFYYNPFETKGERKEFNYLVTSDYPIGQVTISVQQPLRAKDFILKPSPVSVLSDQKGFKYHQYKLQNFSKEKGFTLKAAYLKEDPEPSIQKNAGAPVPGGGNTGYRLIFILFSMAASVLIALAAYWIVSARQGRRVPAGGAIARNTKKGGERFCPNCGTAVGTADNFCSHCGHKTKR